MERQRNAKPRHGQRTQTRERGTSVVEVTLMSPWIFLLFMGIINFGFYAYAMIAVENAARVAALNTSGSGLPDKPEYDAQRRNSACNDVLRELNFLPNVKSLGAWSCLDLPLAVAVDRVDLPNSADQVARASRVTVSYRSAQMFLIPGITDRLTVNRIVEMRTVN